MSQSAYEVLARRYRPKTFAELLGQEHVARALQNALRSGRVAHAFLFTGIRGVGKTSAARLLARALNCKRSDLPTPDPCPDPTAFCSNCSEITEGRSLDVIEIDGASNRGIDDVRELNENVRYRPAGSRYRVYIIDEAHMVTREGFNALLKTLEEPPPHVKFIFATTAPEKFPDTIRSRCQRYDFRRIPVETIVRHLRSIAEQERVALSESALYLVAREAQGSMRDAESLLDRLIARADPTAEGWIVNEEIVSDLLGVTDRRTLHEAAEAVLTGDARRALEVLDRVYAAGRDLERFNRDLLEHLRNLVVVSLYGRDGRILRDLPAEEIDELERQAKLRPIGDVERLFRLALQAERDLRASEMPWFVLEMSLVRMATLAPVLPVDEVLARLEEIEKGIAGELERGSGGRSRPSADPENRGRSDPLGSGRARGGGRVVAGESRGSVENRSDWTGFLSFLQKRRLSLYLPLAHSQLLDESDGRLVVGVAGESLRLQIDTPAALRELETLAAEFFGGPRKLAVVTVEAVPERAPKSPAEVLENPAVKKAIELLGGEVREVRPRR